MAFEDYNIKQFMDALYKKDRSVMTDDILDEVYNEYIDTSGLYEKEEFEKVRYIQFLYNRINTVKISIKVQRRFVEEFGIAYEPSLEIFKKFGFSLKWENKEQFLSDLIKIEIREKKYISQVESKIKELIDLRKSKEKKEPVNKKTPRASFICNIIYLGKIGYKIDYDKTSVEELAYMIKQQE